MKSSITFAVAFLAAAVAGQGCYSPFTMVGNKCLYLEAEMTLSWQEARDFCRGMATDTGSVDLASFPSCDDFVSLSRHLAFDGPSQGTLWVGAHTLFTPMMWQWLSGEDLQTCAPYWAYTNVYDENDNCAGISPEYYYRLVDLNCDLATGFVCEAPVSVAEKKEEARRGLREAECEDHGIVVGDFCYVFYDKAETWQRAEDKCRGDHEDFGGELYYPSGCHEFGHMAHHLEAAEKVGTYWVGAIDVTGEQEWTWVNGQNVPGGPPYWATGEPSHAHGNEPREHCTVMNSEMQYYLQDVHCDERHPYICKLHRL